MPSATRLCIPHTNEDPSPEQMIGPTWDGGCPILVSEYWSGKVAATGRKFETKLLWSDIALYVRFEASKREPLVVIENPDITKKTIGLWDRDVCEIFIAPDKKNRNKYFEFEVASTGEWVDLAIEWSPDYRKTDLEYSSGMEAFASVQTEKIVMAIKIPWTAFGKTPKVGDIWLGNIFRCVGKDPDRGYLAWLPTNTDKPNFHVPSKFGEFEFVK